MRLTCAGGVEDGGSCFACLKRSGDRAPFGSRPSFDEHDEILLIRIRSPEGFVFWIAPGGGVEAGENAVMALQRELDEELGLQDAAIGPAVWRRHHTYDCGSVRISKREEYRMVTIRRFLPSMQDADEAR